MVSVLLLALSFLIELVPLLSFIPWKLLGRDGGRDLTIGFFIFRKYSVCYGDELDLYVLRICFTYLFVGLKISSRFWGKKSEKERDEGLMLLLRKGVCMDFVDGCGCCGEVLLSINLSINRQRSRPTFIYLDGGLLFFFRSSNDSLVVRI